MVQVFCVICRGNDFLVDLKISFPICPSAESETVGGSVSCTISVIIKIELLVCETSLTAFEQQVVDPAVPPLRLTI